MCADAQVVAVAHSRVVTSKRLTAAVKAVKQMAKEYSKLDTNTVTPKDDYMDFPHLLHDLLDHVCLELMYAATESQDDDNTFDTLTLDSHQAILVGAG